MSEPIKLPELFVVRHYGDDERPSIKGNGFDGLTIGEDREEAEQFVAWVNARLAVEQNTADLRKEFDSYENFSCQLVAALRKERDEARAELSACADERNNYSRILTVLGMEEEGDPVAEVDALMQERDQLHEARAELARLTTLRPASEHDDVAKVLWWGDGEFRYIGNEGDDWLCWTPLPDVKEEK